MSLLNQIYGLASAALFVRSEKKIPSETKVLLEKLSLVFSEDESNGNYLYQLFKPKTDLLNTKGFDDGEEFEKLEISINGNTKTKIGLASLFYSFAVYKNLNEEKKEYYINKFNEIINFGSKVEYIDSFKIDEIYKNFNLEAFNSQISQTPADYGARIVNYNWYNLESLFEKAESREDFQKIIKDSENQYYYLSGELLYEGIDIGLPSCVKQNSIISTPTGNVSITIYNNSPCFDKESYIGPVTGIKFYRIFNDGPPSSGYFDQETMEAYIQFDENISNSKDYLSNNKVLYSFSKDASKNYIILKSGVQIDAQGFISSSGEYGYGHTNLITDEEGCRWSRSELESLPLMRMHQGDNSPKYHYYKIKGLTDCYSGVSGPNDWTGWKFTNFELKDSWDGYFNFINTNPRSEKSRILKRALNIENYLDQTTIHSPYLGVQDTGDGVLLCNNYVSFPQLNSNYSSLPGFAFYQTFDNLSFGTGEKNGITGEYTEINIRPAISKSNFSNVNSRSNRNLEISNFNLFSGKTLVHGSIFNKSKIEIKQTINASDITGYDDIFKQCVAIGDNFKNEISGISSLQSNAGYIYTGYVFYKDEEQVNLVDLLSEANTKKVAGKYSTVKYITGYLDSKTNETYSINAFSAHFKDKNLTDVKTPGEYLVYYYFDTITGQGTINSVNTGWSDFAPIPQGIQSDVSNRYKALYGYQKVENYFPRYYVGPFATYENKFLYPNANQFYSKYNSTINGFPCKISYVIKVKEETVREYIGKSGIGQNKSLEYEKVIRAGPGYSTTGLNTLMIYPFVSNEDVYANTYDFDKNKKLYSESGGFNYQANFPEDYVDPFYVPSTNYCTQKNLNSTVYKNYSNSFSNGIAITGQFKERTVYSSNNSTKTISVIEPLGRQYFWGYSGKILSGNLFYTSPIFDLSLLRKNVNENMLSAFFYGSNKIQSTSFQSTNGVLSNDGFINNGSLYSENTTYNGKDPIFYEYIGGRIGKGSELEGGYHSKGIIGDNWYDFYVENFGAIRCSIYDPSYRYPYNDKSLFLFSLNSGSFDIFTKALNYYPYILDSRYKSFNSSNLYQIGINTNSFRVENEYYYNFNLKDKFFPLKTVPTGQLYYESGIDIGPFDRDVELCLLSGNSIVPSGTFIVDGKFLTIGPNLPFYENIFCGGSLVTDIINNFNISNVIAPGENGRNKFLTTFKLVPSGKKVNINISGNNKIGLNKDTIITIRPRTTYPGVETSYSQYISGDSNTLNPLNYINNGSECKFSFKYNDKIEELINKKNQYLTKTTYDVLLPKPNENDFDEILRNRGLLVNDSLGNKIYKNNQPPTLSYWKIKNPNLKAVIVRNASKISFEITSLKIEYGSVPYQSQKIIIPSGKCFISGEFSYAGQAESSLISQGIFISGYTGAEVLIDLYNPRYISDVLKRLPSGIETFPSGSGISPVLDAPSYMKKRKNYFYITGQDEYVPVSPLDSLDYNKFIWPALSDLAVLNANVVYEQLPPDDGTVFTKNNLYFSASQGQSYIEGASGLKNPNENLTYKIKSIYSFVDSVSTNSIYNSGKCIKKMLGTKDYLNLEDLTGILSPENVPISLVPIIYNL